MLDNKLLRNNAKKVAQLLQTRGYEFDLVQFNQLESTRKELQIKTQDLQNQRNDISKNIGIAKKNGKDVSDLLSQVGKFADLLDTNKKDLQVILKQLNDIVLAIPNIPHHSVPIGKNEDDNQVLSKWGVLKKFDFPILDHIELGGKIGLDFNRASKISGARFSVITGKLAKLHRALIQFMLDTHTEKNGYCETYVPYLVNADSLYGTGQLPKFSADLFKTYLHAEGSDSKELYLIPTAEVPLTNMHRDEIIKEDDLPIKYTAHTPNFRSEAGAYGRDTRGLIRQHQFEKVELVQIVRAETSEQVLEKLTNDAENILQVLELPYQKTVLCTGDIGFSACKTYDLEVWLPAQNTYREISSCSLFGDFQARRLNLRTKNTDGKTELLHTLNGSGLAVGRTLVAIMENYQNKDGTISIPKALQGYMNGESLVK